MQSDRGGRGLPHCSSATPNTAASATRGWAAITLSTWAGYTFTPPEMITSRLRPAMVTYPSSSTAAKSPVRSQPSRKAASVAAGSSQYPLITLLLRTVISPTSPGPVRVPSGRRTTASTPGIGRPTEPIRGSSAR